MLATDNLGGPYDFGQSGDLIGLIDCRDWEAPGRYTHREIDAVANACARGLAAKGLKPGDAVGLMAANSAEFLFAYMGVMRAGMIAVPFNYNFPPDTVAFILEDSDIRHVFCDGPRRTKLPAGVPITDFDSDGPDGFQALLDPGPFAAAAPGPGDIAMTLYTSGSTGRPKGVPLSHRGQVWAMRTRIAGAPKPAAAERVLAAAPLFHMNALLTSVGAIAGGACEVLLPEFDAKRYLEAIDRFDCTQITSVPTMLALCVAEPDAIARLDLTSVHSVKMGSAPVSPKLWAQVKETFPKAKVSNGYGTTEAGPIVFLPRPGEPLPEMSCGYPAKDVDVRLVDASGADAEEGELWQRTPATMQGYLNLPEKSAEVLTPDGWYISGDVFRRDENGAYFFVGRADDMFVCGGENIYPGEVEALLVGHPDIVQATVVPVPDEIKGAKPVAFVIAAPGADIAETDVKRHALANAPAFQHPRMVMFLDEMPLAGPGKVDRKGLTARAEAAWREIEAAEA